MALTARYSCVGFDPSGFETSLLQRPRLIGLIRRECIDHVVVFGERHHVLLSYMTYYHDGCYIAQCPNERKPIFSMRAIY
jgi:hypothetical protein